MTDIQFDCPFCSRPMKVPSSAAGKSGKCKTCKNTVIVPKKRQQQNTPQPMPLAPPQPKWWHIPKIVIWMLVIVFTPFACGAMWMLLGTRTERWENTENNLRFSFTDTISNRTGKVTHRVMNTFNMEGDLLCHQTGSMDAEGKPHGLWIRQWQSQSPDVEFYWHGDTCSEEQFYLRKKHLE